MVWGLVNRTGSLTLQIADFQIGEAEFLDNLKSESLKLKSSYLLPARFKFLESARSCFW